MSWTNIIQHRDKNPREYNKRLNDFFDEKHKEWTTSIPAKTVSEINHTTKPPIIHPYHSRKERIFHEKCMKQ